MVLCWWLSACRALEFEALSSILLSMLGTDIILAMLYRRALCNTYCTFIFSRGTTCKSPSMPSHLSHCGVPESDVLRVGSYTSGTVRKHINRHLGRVKRDFMCCFSGHCRGHDGGYGVFVCQATPAIVAERKTPWATTKTSCNTIVRGS